MWFYNNVVQGAHRFAVDIEPMRSTDRVDSLVIAWNQLLGPTMGFVTGAGRTHVTRVTVGANTMRW